MSKKNNDFSIVCMIDYGDMPENRPVLQKSKYNGIYKSAWTLRRGEGIKVKVPDRHVCATIKRTIKRRYPQRKYKVVSQTDPDKGPHVFILRKF